MLFICCADRRAGRALSRRRHRGGKLPAAQGGGPLGRSEWAFRRDLGYSMPTRSLRTEVCAQRVVCIVLAIWEQNNHPSLLPRPVYVLCTRECRIISSVLGCWMGDFIGCSTSPRQATPSIIPPGTVSPVSRVQKRHLHTGLGEEEARIRVEGNDLPNARLVSERCPWDEVDVIIDSL